MDPTEPGDDRTVSLHPDTAGAIADIVAERFSAMWTGALLEQLPKLVAEGVSLRLGAGWQKLGAERLRRAEAEDDARRSARAAYDYPIEQIARRVVEMLDTRDAVQRHGGKRTGRQTPPIDPRLLTSGQAGEYLQVSASHVKKLATDGELQAIWLAGAWKFDIAELDRFIDAQRGGRRDRRDDDDTSGASPT